jgi:uncharacterized protein (TIGR03437 family)
MFRFTLALLTLTPLIFSQKLPAFQWITEVDASGADSFAGLGVDAQGNTYLAGSTYSTAFPVKTPVQGRLASGGLYRIDGPGAAFSALGLSTASGIFVDPQNPNTLFAISSGSLMKSVDGGATFSKIGVPSTFVSTLAIDPTNDQILYAGSQDGLFKSTDAGVTWASSNGSLQPYEGNLWFQGIWIDPTTPNVIFGNILSKGNSLIRSADGGATWQTINIPAGAGMVTFDSANPGTLYTATSQTGFKSADHGLTFSSFAIPAIFVAILPDPKQPGRLVGIGSGAFFESVDGGSTWPQKPKLPFVTTDALGTLIAADWSNGFIYAVVPSPSTVVRITSDLQTATPVGPPATGFIGGITVSNGRVYVAANGSRDVYVTKLDPQGNVVYSTYFGGSADDVATAMAVDRNGNVFVTGTTTSLDFPVTKGAYATTGASFLFKLNPDGSLGYSTYFAPGGNTPAAIAVDATGSAYLAGSSGGNLPVTPGAYQTQCNCASIPAFFITIFQQSGFVTKFDPTGATLVYSTYVGAAVEIPYSSVISSLALGSDGSAYVAGGTQVLKLNASGSALLASLKASLTPQVMTLAPDGSVFVVGTANQFQTTAGAFQTTLQSPPPLPSQASYYPATVVAKYDSQLANLLAATYFGFAKQTKEVAVDSGGNVYIGGASSAQGLPTRTPIQSAFSYNSGFLSELSSDLSTLLFSSYFGDTHPFTVQGIATTASGSVIIGGSTGLSGNATAGPLNIYVNSLTLAPPPALRIDSVVNAASLLDGQITAGETIVVRGAGFGSDAQLMINGAPATPISMTASSITAVVPQTVPAGAAVIQVQSGGTNANQIVVPVSATAPGIFSQDGSGFGQGYILNKDGTLNTPSNPAATGDQITIFATGVGPVSFTQGYAVTQYPVNVFLDGFYCNGVAAVMGPVSGLPGSVYQITVKVPLIADLVANNPDLKNFTFPALCPITVQINSVASQNGIAISISQ